MEITLIRFYPTNMTLTEIHKRIEDLVQKLKENPEDQDFWFNCEIEINYLEQLREQLEEHF